MCASMSCMQSVSCFQSILHKAGVLHCITISVSTPMDARVKASQAFHDHAGVMTLGNSQKPVLMTSQLLPSLTVAPFCIE